MNLRDAGRALIKMEDAFVTGGIAITVVITFFNVFGRYVLKLGFAWAEESVRYLMIWISFVGLGIGIRTHSHIVIDFFIEKVFGSNTEKRIWADRVAYAVSGFFSLLLFASSLVLTVNVFRRDQLSPGLEISMGFAYIMLPPAALIATVRYLLIVIQGSAGEKRYWD